MTDIVFGKVDSVVLFGGGQALLSMLEYVRQTGWSVAVFTSPRQMADVVASSGKSFSEELRDLGIVPCVTDSLSENTEVERLASAGTIGISLDAPWIFKKEFIDRFGGRLVNCHGMRLPQYRGGGGYTWPVMRRSRLGYSLIHRVTPGIDDGEIIAVREFVFPDWCKQPGDYFQVTAQEDRILFGQFISAVAAGGSFKSIGQPEYLSVYFPRLHTPSHGLIDWSWKSADIVSFIAAFDRPYPGASTFLRGKRIYLRSATEVPSDGQFHPFQAGLVYRIWQGAYFVAARNRGIRVESIVSAEGGSLPSVRLGDRLHTPASALDTARQFRASYDARGLHFVKPAIGVLIC